MSVSLTLLGLLDRAPSHGYDLKRHYDRLFGNDRSLSFGQVYATLARLTRDGLIVSQAEPGDGPERKSYAITDAGHDQVADWLNEPVEPAPQLQTLLFIKVVLALLLDRDAAGYLVTQRRTHLARMRELTEMKRTGGPAELLLADYGLFHLEADLRWIDLTEARLGTLAETVRQAETGRNPGPATC